MLPQLPQNFVNQLVDALLHVLISIVRLILLPFSLWVKSIGKLAEQKKNGLLNLETITGLWPFFSYCKRLTLDFIFDAVTFLLYPLGVLYYIVSFISDVADGLPFVDGLEMLLIALIGLYLTPLFVAFFHNAFVLVLLPIRKLIDWFKKPAQQVDLNVTKIEK